MLARQKFYTGFYLLGFTLAIVLSLTIGFEGMNSHTPPAAYALELLILSIGLMLFLRDLIITRPLNFRYIRVHVFGLAANAALVAVVVWTSLNR